MTLAKRPQPTTRVARGSRPALLLVAVALAGCNHAHNADVVATVNGKPIMKAEMEKQYQAQLGEAQQQQPLTQEQSDSLRLNVLGNLINEEIIEQRLQSMIARYAEAAE